MADRIQRITIRNEVKNGKELDRLARQYGRLNKNVKRSSDSLDFFKRSFQLAIGGIGLRELTRAADQFQLLRDRIKVFTGSGEAANKVFSDLALAARFTRTSINSLAQSYNRIALATQELGLNSDQILATTVALQQTFRLSGATIAEATAATIQLSQGLSSGQLRGQELRSVLEQNAVFANLLSEELGITRGQLIKFAESGKITNDVVLNVLSKNFDKLNAAAANLGTTINQSLTIALDAIRLKIAELNREFGISTKIEDFTKLFLNNIKGLFSAVSVLLAAGIIEKFIALVKGVELSLAGLATVVSPTKAVALAIIGLGFAIDRVSKAQEEFKRSKPIDERIQRTAKTIQTLERSLARGGQTPGGLAILRKNLENNRKELDRLQGLARKGIKIEPPKKTGVEKLIDDLSAAFKKFNLEAQKTDLGQFNSLNKQFRNGTIVIDEYREAVKLLQFEQLDKKFQDGKISIDQYNQSLIKLNANLALTGQIALGAEAGLNQVAESASNVALQIQQGFVRAFKSLEDAIFEFTKKGRFDFAKFAQSVIDELTRIVIRAQIIAPIARGVGQLLFAGGGGGLAAAGGGGAQPQLLSAGTFANGGAFLNGRVTPFASGGVVSSPTLFPMANGAGLMGEAGPEAIMPLVRRNGKLGVEGGGSGTVVNIINNTGAEVETEEKVGPSGEKILDVTIKRKVQESFNNGSMDRVMSENFGLRRKGR